MILFFSLGYAFLLRIEGLLCPKKELQIRKENKQIEKWKDLEGAAHET